MCLTPVVVKGLTHLKLTLVITLLQVEVRSVQTCRGSVQYEAVSVKQLLLQLALAAPVQHPHLKQVQTPPVIARPGSTRAVPSPETGTHATCHSSLWHHPCSTLT